MKETDRRGSVKSDPSSSRYRLAVAPGLVFRRGLRGLRPHPTAALVTRITDIQLLKAIIMHKSLAQRLVQKRKRTD
jgi:hypothetical protein